ncbi:FtsX-like permease family protein [Paenibacillus sp. DMB20]|uniref:FtsX-like permease family protein n=1 Tax=Paenibacillus sp. DMB20 TaxID=1642570 RepID=UPI002E12F550
MNINSKVSAQVSQTIREHPEHEILYHESLSLLEADADSSGLYKNERRLEQTFTVLSNRDFNRLAKRQGRDPLSLKAEEAVALDSMYLKGLTPEYVDTSITLNANGASAEIEFIELKKYNVLNQATVYSTIVVSDELFAKLKPNANMKNIEAYGITNQDKAKTLTEALERMMPEEAKFTSFYSDYARGMEASGLIIFMGGFLGLVFLVATGSIIYFKQLTEANSDKSRYLILYKIGVKKSEIRKSVAKQVMFVFAMPLMAGIAHCTVALYALSGLMLTNLVVPVIICMGIYICIYLIYYFLTVNAYCKIVTNFKS